MIERSRTPIRRAIAAALLVGAMVMSLAPRATASGPAAPNPQAVVLRAIDGETIEVRVGDQVETVRYIGVRTPIIHHPTKGADYYRQQATAANAALVDGQEATLQLGAVPRDSAGRLLAFVYANGQLVNAELVRTGFAEVVTIPPNFHLRRELLTLQVQAQMARVGLWADVEAHRFYGPTRSGVVASRRTGSFFHVDDDTRGFDEQREYFESPEAAFRAGYKPSFNYPVYDEIEWRTRRAAVDVPYGRVRTPTVVAAPSPSQPPPVGHVWRGGVITPIYAR